MNYMGREVCHVPKSWCVGICPAAPIGRLPPKAGQLAEQLLLLRAGADDRLAVGLVLRDVLVDVAEADAAVRVLLTLQGLGRAWRLKPYPFSG
jgi:hypothetical protein